MNAENRFRTNRSALPKQLRDLTKKGIPYAIQPKGRPIGDPTGEPEVDVLLPDLPVREYDSVRKIFLDYTFVSRIR